MTKTARYSYDQKCEELAEYFCQDLIGHASYKDIVRRLAQDIQDAVEALDFEVPHDSALSAQKESIRE